MGQAITEPPERKASQSFECSNCGATLVYGADSAKLECDYCESEHEIGTLSEAVSESSERKLSELFKGGELRKITDKMVLECEQCGASSTVEGRRTTSTCAFCASEMVKERDPKAQMVPVGLIPFKIAAEKAGKAHKAWLKSLWFCPNDLKNQAKVAEIEGVYTPFWTFDARAESRWKADSGTHYYETETYKDHEGKKRTRRVQHTRWKSARGRRAGTYDDMLVCGSRGLSTELIRRLEPFHTTTELQPYQGEYLAGWGAEEYALGPEAAWSIAKGLMEEQEFTACGDDVPGDTYRGLQVSTKLSEATGKYVLLPVWIAAYRYKDRSFRFLVNGQTGEVSGEAPKSWWKIVALATFLVFVLFTILGTAGAAFIPWCLLFVMWAVWAWWMGWFSEPRLE